MTINPSSSRPLYQQLADLLRAEMRQGKLPAGSAIPSTAELVNQHSVSKATARQAVELLEREGFVQGAQGRGVFVRKQPLIYHYGQTRYLRERRPPGTRPFEAEATEQGYNADQVVLAVGLDVPPADVAAQLILNVDQLALVRRHLLLADGVPIALADSWYRLDFADDKPRLQLPDRIEEGAHAYIADTFGITLQGSTEELRTREPTANEIERLALRTGEWVLQMLRMMRDDRGGIVQVGLWALAGDRNVMVFDVPAN